MGKQEFETAAQVCAVDNILWTKFLLLLPKFSYSRINQDSCDCATIGIGDDWRGLFKTKIEIMKTNEHTTFRDQRDKWNGHKMEANISRKEGFGDSVT